jgi:hypothetical protein
MKPISMTEIIDGKRYSTDTAALLAGDDYWDGRNFERSGTNCFLYKTPKGSYFTLSLTRWEGQCDTILPCDTVEARELFEGMRNKRVSYEEAFPGYEIRDA